MPKAPVAPPMFPPKAPDFLFWPPQLAASFISNQMCDVAYWHVTDKPAAPGLVRFRTTADDDGFWPAMVCPLMTRSGHKGRMTAGGHVTRYAPEVLKISDPFPIGGRGNGPF